MKKQQSGFTLIELIMVIVVLGILAAFALPRFADFGGDARLAAMQGAVGAVKSASAIAHSQALISAPVSNKIKLEGADVDMDGTYPAATIAGIFAAAQLNASDFKGTPSAVGADPAVLTVESAAKSTCSFTYSLAAGGATAPAVDTTNLTIAKCK